MEILQSWCKQRLPALVQTVLSATSETSGWLLFYKKMVHPGGFEPPTARFVAEYSIQLSYGCIGITALTMKQQATVIPSKYGASGRIRTSDRSVRSRVLYPAELRMHREYLFTTLIQCCIPRYTDKDGASGRMTRLSTRPAGRC